MRFLKEGKWKQKLFFIRDLVVNKLLNTSNQCAKLELIAHAFY